MGLIDIVICIAVAAIVVVLYSTNTIDGTIALVLGAFAIIFIITIFVSFCPLFLVWNFNPKKNIKCLS